MAFLEMTGIRKRFGGVVALNGASLACERGEVHALLGANGSGKSTLNKVLTGIIAPDAGEVRLAGQRVSIAGPLDAHRRRIAAVYQELSLIPQLTVADNIVLPHEPANRLGFVSRKGLLAKARRIAARFEQALGRPIPLHYPVESLSPGDQQLVEILKAIGREPDVLILDEATASLHKAEVDALFRVVKELRERGTLVIFISHRMEEVYALCDRATILRNGETVGTVALRDTSGAELVRMMVGEAVSSAGRRAGLRQPARSAVLQVKGLSAGRLKDVTFALHAGEVLGLGGLQGQGQSELLAALFGALPLRAGEVMLEERRVRWRRPGKAVREGLAFVPGNRARQGLFLRRSILENLTFASLARRAWLGGVLSPQREAAAAHEMVRDLQIKIGSHSDPVSSLSGGNQQKVVVGKWLLNRPRVVLMDDPTKGVDVGAKAELYELIEALTRQGSAIVLNSSDNAELLRLSDRVLILYEGRVVESLERHELTEERLVAAALRLPASPAAPAAGAPPETAAGGRGNLA